MHLKIRHFLANIVCGVIPRRKTRDLARTKIIHSKLISKYKKFIKQYTKDNNIPYKYKLGVGPSCANITFILNNQCVFKFPLKKQCVSDNKQKVKHETRIVNALKHVSPIKIPDMELIEWNGIIIRKYEFIPGKPLPEIPAKQIKQHIPYLAKELANFLYQVAKYDPKKIQDLKPKANLKPDFLYGWCQNDMVINCMVDPNTMKIYGIIDWEGTEFIDLKRSLNNDLLYLCKHKKAPTLMIDIMAEYAKLYYQNYHKS